MTPSSPISENYPEQRKQTGRFLIVLLLFCVFAAVLGLLNLMLGSVSLSWQELGQAFTEAGRGSTAYKILFEIRLPRLLAAFLLGGALAVSGFLLQTFFANPLAKKVCSRLFLPTRWQALSCWASTQALSLPSLCT